MIVNLPSEYKEFDLQWFHDAYCNWIGLNTRIPVIMLMHPKDEHKFHYALVKYSTMHGPGIIEYRFTEYRGVRIVRTYDVKENTFEFYGDGERF
jgi:hypothetical protein